MRKRMLHGLLMWVLASACVLAFGPRAVDAALPLHEDLSEFLGMGYAAELSRIDEAGKPMIFMQARALEPLTYAGRMIPRDTSWQVRVDLDVVTQQWIVAMVLATVVPLASMWRRFALLIAAAAAAWCVQFLTVPVLLASGVVDVVSASSGSVDKHAAAVLMHAYDLALQNGGTWVPTFALFLLAYAGVTQPGGFGIDNTGARLWTALRDAARLPVHLRRLVHAQPSQPNNTRSPRRRRRASRKTRSRA